MGKFTAQINSELKLLPFMLGKLIGGIISIVGFTMLVVKITRNSNVLFDDIMLSLMLGGGGIAIFVLSAKCMVKRQCQENKESLIYYDSKRTNMLSWVLLLLIAAVFLVCSYFMTR